MIDRIWLHWLGAGFLLAIATPASADPCEGELPSRAGQVFAGVVRYVGDGDSLCIGSNTNPGEWIEVRLADFDAPELQASGGELAKFALARVALHRPVTCTAERGRSGRVVVFDRVIARCRIGGASIGDMLRVVRAREGGR
ncbi:thermonuclease family protein [Tistrella mobilis]|uniref:thermonuclease family protein n=1 Tax=Tistrella mobilis TaxID=171437 RepID=UPI001E4CFDF9|nr:hypothetical protein [Tistrella mobilis]